MFVSFADNERIPSHSILVFCINCCTVTWDGFNRKRLTALPAFGTSVAALAFNHDGTTLAMASSYTFEEGERDHPRDEIFIRRMLDSDCQPKTQS